MPTFIIDPRIDPRRAPNQSLLDGIFQLRHKVFREQLGWNVESNNGREIDCYDTTDAVYGIAIDWSGVVEGCFRLLPTTGPYLLADVFPDLLHGQSAPRGLRVLNSGRFAVLPKFWRPNYKSEVVAITCRLLLVQLAYCISLNIRQIVSVTDIYFERIQCASGLICERFGPPVRSGKTSIVATRLCPDQRNIKNISRVLEAIEAKKVASSPSRLLCTDAAAYSETVQ